MVGEIGITSYTFRRFDVRRAIDVAAEVGAPALDLWPRHLPADTAESEVDAVLQHCRRRGVRICGYGVVGLSAERTGPHLRMARRLGCDYVSVDVPPEDRGVQGEAVRLAEELGLRLAIHNHGPGHHFSRPESVAAVLSAQPEGFGACVDTGHFLRSNVDPVQAITQFGRRVHAVHLKDFTEAGVEVLPGRGRLDLPATLAALDRAGLTTACVIEYEGDADDPAPAVRAAVAAVAAARGAGGG